MSAPELVVVLVAIMAGALVKSVTGMGLPILTVPIMALFVSVEDAVVVIAAANVALNGSLCWREREHRHASRDLPVLAAFGIAGAVLGAFLLAALPERAVMVALAAMLIAYIVRFLVSPDLRLSPQTSKRWAPAVGFATGLSQGSTGISGPIVGTWIHSYRLPPGAHIFSITLLFCLAGGAQVAVFAADGRLGERIGEVAITFVPVFAVMPFGTALRDRLSGPAFDRAVLGVLCVSAAALLIRAVS